MMIKSQREYFLTRAQLERFKEALEELEADVATGRPQPPEYDPMIPEITRRALLSQMEELQEELDEWEERKHD